MRLRALVHVIGCALALQLAIGNAAADEAGWRKSSDTTSSDTKDSETRLAEQEGWTTSASFSTTASPGPLPRGTDVFLWYLNATWLGSPAEATLPEPDLTPDAVAYLANFDQVATAYATPGPSFDVDAFEQAILDRMQGLTVGFSYAINQGGQLERASSRGEIRNEADGSAGMTEHQRINIASISKNITAVAVLQLLEANGLSVFDPVGPWLPGEWQLGYGFANPASITFYDLLTHRSGIKQSALVYLEFDEALAQLDLVQWDGLEAIAEIGILPAFHGDAEYTNVNYALFRALIPALWEASGGLGYDTLDASEAAALYQNYVGQHVLQPSGVYQAACHENFLPIEPRYYDANDPNAPGEVGGNWTLRCGSGGWVLSAVDLAAFLAHARYDDDVLSSDMRTIMDAWEMGWQPVSSLAGHGTFLSHGGALWWAGDAGERAETVGCVMKFPIQVEAVVLANSSIVGDPNPCNILRDAYDEAWIP